MRQRSLRSKEGALARWPPDGECREAMLSCLSGNAMEDASVKFEDVLYALTWRPGTAVRLSFKNRLVDPEIREGRAF